MLSYRPTVPTYTHFTGRIYKTKFLGSVNNSKLSIQLSQIKHKRSSLGNCLWAAASLLKIKVLIQIIPSQIGLTKVLLRSVSSVHWISISKTTIKSLKTLRFQLYQYWQQCGTQVYINYSITQITVLTRVFYRPSHLASHTVSLVMWVRPTLWPKTYHTYLTL